MRDFLLRARSSVIKDGGSVIEPVKKVDQIYQYHPAESFDSELMTPFNYLIPGQPLLSAHQNS